MIMLDRHGEVNQGMSTSDLPSTVYSAYMSRGYLLRKVAALPEVLQDAGYHTMISGKWHLGRSPDKIPAAWGFDRSYSFLHGCHNHYAWEPQFRENNKEDEVSNTPPQ